MRVQSAIDDVGKQGVFHIVINTAVDEDLGVIADACRDMPLLTGFSALAMPLPDLYHAVGLVAPDAFAAIRPEKGSGAIVLSGISSTTTRAPVANCNAGAPSFALDSIVHSESGPQAALDCLAEHPPNSVD